MKINVLPNWFYYIDYLKELYRVKYFDRNEENLPHKIFEMEDDEHIIDEEVKNDNINSINNFNNFDSSIDEIKNNELEMTNNNNI